MKSHTFQHDQRTFTGLVIFPGEGASFFRVVCGRGPYSLLLAYFLLYLRGSRVAGGRD